MRTTQEAKCEAFTLPPYFVQVLPEMITPDQLKASPVIQPDMQALAQHLCNLGKNGRGTIHTCLEQLHSCRVSIEEIVYFVPFDLKSDQDRYNIIGIANTGNVSCQPFFPIIEPFASPCRSGD